MSNRLYRFNNKKTWNDVFDEVADPDEIGMRKTDDVVVNVSDKSGLQKFSLLLNDLIQYNRLIHVYTGLKFMAFDCLYKGMMVKKVYSVFQYLHANSEKKKNLPTYLPTPSHHGSGLDKLKYF